jgi:hypothetical protein
VQNSGRAGTFENRSRSRDASRRLRLPNAPEYCWFCNASGRDPEPRTPEL